MNSSISAAVQQPPIAAAEQLVGRLVAVDMLLHA
jgi:hypothetical protein